MNLLVTLFSIVLTISIYLISRKVGVKYPSPFTTPVFFSTTIIILILSSLHINFEQYTPAKDIMTYLLGPATVALAVPLYRNRDIIRRYFIPAMFGLFAGTLSTIISGVFIVKAFNLDKTIAASMATKSITVPIAVEVTKLIGGDTIITAAFVICTGIIGTMIGPFLLTKVNISNPIARGLALGTISHGQGTAQAAMEGELQGAVAGVAMGLAAIVTSILLPILSPLLL